MNEREYDYIVSVLELFEGQISYSELIHLPIPELHRMIDAKDRMIKAKVKKQQDEMMRAQNEKNQKPANFRT